MVLTVGEISLFPSVGKTTAICHSASLRMEQKKDGVISQPALLLRGEVSTARPSPRAALAGRTGVGGHWTATWRALSQPGGPVVPV